MVELNIDSAHGSRLHKYNCKCFERGKELRERKESTKKYQINYYDYNDMCNLFENDNKLREILYDNYSVEKYVK